MITKTIKDWWFWASGNRNSLDFTFPLFFNPLEAWRLVISSLKPFELVILSSVHAQEEFTHHHTPTQTNKVLFFNLLEMLIYVLPPKWGAIFCPWIIRMTISQPRLSASLLCPLTTKLMQYICYCRTSFQSTNFCIRMSKCFDKQPSNSSSLIL